jgi:hypothetical protein
MPEEITATKVFKKAVEEKKWHLKAEKEMV